jgi:hypothetical protein
MSTLITDASSRAVQLFHLSGVRTNVTTTDGTTTAATALPSGLPDVGALVEVRATDTCYVAFGDASVDAEATSASMLFPAGEKVLQLPSGVTHFAVIRAGSTNISVQVERLD